MTADTDPATPPRTDLTPIVDACRRRDADAFVAVGGRCDADVRYLTRVNADRAVALVVVPDDKSNDGSAPRAVLVAPESIEECAERGFIAPATLDDDRFHDGVAREVRTAATADSIGKRAAAVLAERLGTAADATVLVPRTIPHDAAVSLEHAGATLASTTAVTDARAIKTDAEIDRLRRVQRAAVTAMSRAETMLAESTVLTPGNAASSVDDDVDGQHAFTGSTPVLCWRDEPLTVERLRRRVNAALAEAGTTDAENTVVVAGPDASTSVGSEGPRVIRPGETVLVDLAPRGPHGYHGRLARTFVVESDGGWERRAYVATSAALEAALGAIEPGADADAIHREATAELAAYGFDPTADPDESGVASETGHGVGMARREAPSLRSETTLQAGHAIAVGPGVSDPAVGGVRLADLVVVDDDGFETVAPYPLGTVPERRDE